MSTETFPSDSEANTRPINIKAYEGYMKTVEIKRPAVTIDGYDVVTNLPADKAAGFYETAKEYKKGYSDHPFYRDVAPSGIDDMPAGTYFMKDPIEDDPLSDNVYIITDNGEDKRISRNGSGIYGELFNNHGHSEHLMSILGFTYDQEGLVDAIPSPQTLKKRAAQLGVEVQLFPGKGALGIKDYLGAFAEGKYPVSTGNAKYYAHDIQDDHLSGMVLGGELLKNSLRDAARKALDYPTDDDDTTANIDRFTSHLRATVSPTKVAIGRKSNLARLVDVGFYLGIDPEKVKEILATARWNAQKYGLTLKPEE